MESIIQDIKDLPESKMNVEKSAFIEAYRTSKMMVGSGPKTTRLLQNMKSHLNLNEQIQKNKKMLQESFEADDMEMIDICELELELFYTLQVEDNCKQAQVCYSEDAYCEYTDLLGPQEPPKLVNVTRLQNNLGKYVDNYVSINEALEDTNLIECQSISSESGIYTSMSDISSLADCYEDHNYRELQSEIKVLRGKLSHLEAKNGCLEKTQFSSKSIIDSLKNSLEMSEISNKLLQERCQYLENNLIENNKELSAAKKEVASTREIISDNTRVFSQSLEGVFKNLAKIMDEIPTQKHVMCLAEPPWDRDFREIHERLNKEEKNYVQNALLTVEEKIGYISKYLNYRKVDYLPCTFEDISGLKKDFTEKMSRTQKYIKHLKRENDALVMNYQMDYENIEVEYRKLEEDYNILQQQHAVEVKGYMETIKILNEEKKSIENDFHFFKEVNKKLLDEHQEKYWNSQDVGVSKGEEIRNNGKVKKFDIKQHLQNFATPFQLSENEKLLKSQVENLTNSKKANEKVKKQLKKEISKLHEDNEELKENLKMVYEYYGVNTQLQNMVMELKNKQDDLMKQEYAVTDEY